MPPVWTRPYSGPFSFSCISDYMYTWCNVLINTIPKVRISLSRRFGIQRHCRRSLQTRRQVRHCKVCPLIFPFILDFKFYAYRVVVVVALFRTACNYDMNEFYFYANSFNAFYQTAKIPSLPTFRGRGGFVPWNIDQTYIFHEGIFPSRCQIMNKIRLITA